MYEGVPIEHTRYELLNVNNQRLKVESSHPVPQVKNIQVMKTSALCVRGPYYEYNVRGYVQLSRG